MELWITSILTFASTNIDDIFLLILFYHNQAFRHKHIVTGQLLGIGALIAVSFTASFLGLFIPMYYIGMLGLFPIYLGIKGFLKLRHQNQPPAELGNTDRAINTSKNIVVVAGVTIANGGDNIAIYIPMFTHLTMPHKLTMIAIFFAMTLLWRALAKYLASHPLITNTAHRWVHLITPLILILLGWYIMYESQTFQWLFG